MEGLGYIGAWLGQAQPRQTLSGSGNMFNFGQHALSSACRAGRRAVACPFRYEVPRAKRTVTTLILVLLVVGGALAVAADVYRR